MPDDYLINFLKFFGRQVLLNIGKTNQNSLLNRFVFLLKVNENV